MDIKKLDDLYDILGVDFGCSLKEIKHEFHKKINFFKNKLNENGGLSDREKFHVKAVRTSFFVLSNNQLRKKYDLSRIIGDTEESEDTPEEKKQVSSKLDHFQYSELSETNNLKKTEKGLDFDKLSDRQFQRYDQSFEIDKDRQLRGANFERKLKKG